MLTLLFHFYTQICQSQPEFLGRAIVTPKFNLCREEYVHPKLEWCDLFRGPHKAGQLLASFEFIEVFDDCLFFFKFHKNYCNNNDNLVDDVTASINIFYFYHYYTLNKLCITYYILLLLLLPRHSHQNNFAVTLPDKSELFFKGHGGNPSAKTTSKRSRG